MTILLFDLNPATLEPILAAIGLISAFAIIFLAIKGKLRDWFLR